MKAANSRKTINKYVPISVLLISVILSYLCISYRKQDWVTGGLLLNICIPVILVEIITVVGFFLSNKLAFKRLFLLVEILLLIAIFLFYIVYITQYN